MKTPLISILTMLCMTGFAPAVLAEDPPEEQSMSFDLSALGTTSQSSLAESDPRHPLLKGSIEHSDRLPPIDASLRAGLTFDASKLPKLTPGNNWHWIPDWLAGGWKTETSTCYYRKDLNFGSVSREPHTIIARSHENEGFQRDRDGGIWEYEYCPYTAYVDCGNATEVQLIKDVQPIEVTQEKAVYLFLSTDIRYDKQSREILLSGQSESLQTYTPDGPDAFKCVSSIKSFDQSGNPSSLQKNVNRAVRIQPFGIVYRYHGLDMSARFKDYLTSHGLAHLVPDQQAPIAQAPKLPVGNMPKTGGRK